MPLIAWAVASYAAGLLVGFTVLSSATITGGTDALVTIVAAATCVRLVADATGRSVRSARVLRVSCAVVCVAGIVVARQSVRSDARCVSRAVQASQWTAARAASPCAALVAATAPPGPLERWRARAAATIDTLFPADAPLVRALLIADTRNLDPELRDRFAAAGLVHILSISGLHVAIIAEAVLLAVVALRVARPKARWIALGLTALYVAAIGAPPPALRSAAMLGASTFSRATQRPVSPWAALALGAAVPLVDPHNVLDLGWQLSVAGYAALTAAGIWCTRHLPHDLRGWRKSLTRDFVVSVLATAATAPLVAWAFGRLSLVAPLTNIAAGPVIGMLQPALFAALMLAPFRPVAMFVASAAHPLIVALDGVARAGAAVPFGSLSVAPTLAVAVSAAIGSAALLIAASSRRPGPAFFAVAASVVACCWWPLVPAGTGYVEMHVIDVGQGDAIAVRTPRGRWMLFDAGRTWNGGDAGRSVVVPYLRRFGGDLVLFVLSHPHADHVGGAASVLTALHPQAYRDAAFAGSSPPYRRSLETATALGVPWWRVHPGDAVTTDGVTVTFLAPDSAWTAHLNDPNLASTIALVQYRDVRFLLTGDAEAPEEEWLLSHVSALLRADVLKVGHHGSITSTTPRFLDQVRPRVAVVSVGAGNAYGLPNTPVMAGLRDRGILVLRTDQLGTIVIRTDGHSLRVRAGQREWAPPSLPE